MNSLNSIFNRNASVMQLIFSLDYSVAVVVVVTFLNCLASCMVCGVVAINMENANGKKRILLPSCLKFIINTRDKLS